MPYTFATSGSATARAGNNVHPFFSGAYWDDASLMSEGRIIAETGYDWLTNFATAVSGAQSILLDTSSALMAMEAVSFDTSRYRFGEAELILNRLDDRAKDGLRQLRDLKNKEIKS